VLGRVASGDGPDSLANFETDPEPASEPDPAPETDRVLTRSSGTTIGIAIAVVLTAATVFVARSLLADAGIDVGLGQTVTVALIALVVALAGFLPLRWGLWVVPTVTGAHYGLNFYNMLLNDSSVYQFLPGSAMGYAVLTPAVGVALGWVLEGVYRLIAP
jgi:hypothetical protein